MYPSSRLARWQHRAYLFGVTALAIVWAGSFGWKAISVRSTVYQATAGVEGPGIDKLLAGGASQRLAADGVQISQAVSDSSTDSGRLTVTATATSPTEAIRIANQAAEQLAEPAKPSTAQDGQRALAQGRNETARAREQLAAVQDAMAALVANAPKLDETLLSQQPNDNPPEPGPRLTATDPPVSNVPPENDVPLTNPAWEQQHNELTALEAKRRELLQHMTEAHPAVRRLDEEIAGAIERLVATPKTIAKSTGQESAPQPTAPSSAPQERPDQPQQVASLPDSAALQSLRQQQQQFAAELASQMQRLRQAETRLEECLAAERKLALAAEPRADVKRRRVLPAMAAGNASFSAPRWLVATTLLLSLGGGVVMAHFGGRRLEKVASRSEAERLLPIPVIGLVAPADANEPRPSPLPRLVAQFTRRACEATLATAIVGTILLGIADFRADSGMTGQTLRWGWDALQWLTSW
jgi:hypothetical protein